MTDIQKQIISLLEESDKSIEDIYKHLAETNKTKAAIRGCLNSMVKRSKILRKNRGVYGVSESGTE